MPTERKRNGPCHLGCSTRRYTEEQVFSCSHRVHGVCLAVNDVENVCVIPSAKDDMEVVLMFEKLKDI